MGSKTDGSGQMISLPKGGGAQHGLGEKFSPDLHTGTGNFTIPIALPPGRNGFQPQLSLVYSTGNGNGLFGLGWNLSVPGVTRKTSKGIPRYRDYDKELKERDTFILSGAEDLVPVDDVDLDPKKATRYRPRTEGLFAKIIHHHDGQAKKNFWEVCSKDGLVSYYGTNVDDSPAVKDDPAVITKHSDPSRVFAWKLTLTKDPFGNLTSISMMSGIRAFPRRRMGTCGISRSSNTFNMLITKTETQPSFSLPSRSSTKTAPTTRSRTTARGSRSAPQNDVKPF